MIKNELIKDKNFSSLEASNKKNNENSNLSPSGAGDLNPLTK